MTSKDASGSFLEDLQRAVQDNPVPAALIGLGAVWMLFHRREASVASALGSVAVGAANASGGIAEALTKTATKTARGLAEGMSTMGQAATAAVGRAGEALTEAGSQAADSAAQHGTTASQAASKFGGALQSNLAETFERQPLLVGAVGLALGAAIASAFPKTRLEQDLVGDQAAAAAEHAKALASEQGENLAEAAQRAIAAARDEAKAQGLTPEQLKQRASSVRDKVSNVVSSARNNGQSTTH